LRPGARARRVDKLAGDFLALGGGAVDAKGKLYFIDRQLPPHPWLVRRKGLSIVPITARSGQPRGRSIGHLMVLSSDGPEATVYSSIPAIRPASARDRADARRDRAGARVALPGSFWNNGEFRDQYDPASDRIHDARRDVRARHGRAQGARICLARRQPGLPAFASGSRARPIISAGASPIRSTPMAGSPARSASASMSPTDRRNGPIAACSAPAALVTDLKPFAARGGESVAVGPDGRVYVANGQVFVYGADGRELGRIDVPERPLQILFGGPDGERSSSSPTTRSTRRAPERSREPLATMVVDDGRAPDPIRIPFTMVVMPANRCAKIQTKQGMDDGEMSGSPRSHGLYVTAYQPGALATVLAGRRFAQTAPAAGGLHQEAVPQVDAEQADQEGEIIVTGTRIMSSGFTAPTPTTVIGEEQIAANAQPNIFNTIAQLPSLQGSTGPPRARSAPRAGCRA
jgi:hypothetical protein